MFDLTFFATPLCFRHKKGLRRMEHLHKEGVNVCFIKNRSKHNSNTLLSLLPIFMKQTLTMQFIKKAKKLEKIQQQIDLVFII